MRRPGRNVSNAVWVDKEADGTMAYIPSRLVVMLTYQDKTVVNALEVFETCAGAKAQFWGFKEAGLPLAEMAALTQRMKQAGKTVFLEVVSYTEQEGLKGAQAAAFCGCDRILHGSAGAPSDAAGYGLYGSGEPADQSDAEHGGGQCGKAAVSSFFR